MANKTIAGCRVLVVEDDVWIGMDMVDTLERAGADVVGPVASVREALGALATSPDLASLDVHLGSETSFSVADELSRRGIPFIFATAAADEIPFAHQGRAVCTKPVSERALLCALSALFV